LVPTLNTVISYESFYFEFAVLGIIDDQGIFLLYDVFCLFFSFISLFYSIAYKKAPLNNNYNGFLCEKNSHFVLNWLMFFQVFGVVLFLLSTGFDTLDPIKIIQNVLSDGRFSYWKNDSHSTLLMTLSFYFSHCSVLYFFYDVKFKTSSLVRTLISIGCVILMVVLTGARGWIIAAVSGSVISMLLYRKPPMLFLIFFASFGTIFMLAFQVFRRTWSFDFGVEELSEVIIQGDLSWFYYASLESFRQYQEGLQFYPLNFLRQLLFLPFPNEFTFGMKERDLPFLFESAIIYASDIRAGNFPPGLFGVFILNFGRIGAIIGPLFFFAFLYFFDKSKAKLGLISEVFLSISLLLVLQLYRGAMMGFYYWFFLSIILFLILILLSFYKKIKIILADRK